MQQTLPQISLGGLVLPIYLKNLVASVDKVAGNQEGANRILEDICKALQGVDLESALKHDITDGASIKRRLQRIKIMIGNHTGPNSNDNVMKEWEYCVERNLNMTKRELLRSVDYKKKDTSVFDIMDEIPEFRKIGVDILVAFERKYEISPALYSVEQVRQIGTLRREFDHSIIRLMDEREFTHWVNKRYMEIDTMLEDKEPRGHDYGNYGRYKLYWMFAKKHPDLIPERQLKYLSEMELVNICNRAINDDKEEGMLLRANCGKYFPFSNRKHDTKLLKDSFINIILRCLIY